MNGTILLVLLFFMVLASLGAVMMKSLLKGAIALALTSLILTVILFLLQSPLAAVFELSVCAGLITVVFVSAIALTRPESSEEEADSAKERRSRFIHLPIVAVIAAVGLFLILTGTENTWVVHKAAVQGSISETLWRIRPLEILGQMAVVLAGVFGVIVLFKEGDSR